MNHTHFHIGCSGYYYPQWKNKFYPEGLAQKKWLAYYSTIFNTVELNGTFYRIPKLNDLIKYSTVTPTDFKFSVKVNKYITHNLKLKNAKKDISDFQDLITEGLEKKCAHFLFQMPPSFHCNEENLGRVLENIPHKFMNVIEFRHVSWWNEKVCEILSKASISFCNIDFPGLQTSFLHTTSHFYLRLHGNPELFKSSYNEEHLNFFYKKIPADSKSCSVYFNNTIEEAAYINARQLMNIISHHHS